MNESVKTIINQFLEDSMAPVSKKLNAFQRKMKSLKIRRGRRIEDVNAIKNSRQK